MRLFTGRAADVEGLSEARRVLGRAASATPGDPVVLERQRHRCHRRLDPQRAGAARLSAGDVLHDAGNGQHGPWRTATREGRRGYTRSARPLIQGANCYDKEAYD